MLTKIAFMAIKGLLPIPLLSCWVLSQTQQAVVHRSARADVTITNGDKCNEPNPPGRIKYIKNSNGTKCVVVKLKVLRTPSEGESESEYQSLRVYPKGRVELGWRS